MPNFYSLSEKVYTRALRFFLNFNGQEHLVVLWAKQLNFRAAYGCEPSLLTAVNRIVKWFLMADISDLETDSIIGFAILVNSLYLLSEPIGIDNWRNNGTVVSQDILLGGNAQAGGFHQKLIRKLAIQSKLHVLLLVHFEDAAVAGQKPTDNGHGSMQSMEICELLTDFPFDYHWHLVLAP